MYSNVVLGVSSDNFEHILEGMKEEKGVKLDTELTPAPMTSRNSWDATRSS